MRNYSYLYTEIYVYVLMSFMLALSIWFFYVLMLKTSTRTHFNRIFDILTRLLWNLLNNHNEYIEYLLNTTFDSISISFYRAKHLISSVFFLFSLILSLLFRKHEELAMSSKINETNRSCWVQLSYKKSNGLNIPMWRCLKAAITDSNASQLFSNKTIT